MRDFADTVSVDYHPLEVLIKGVEWTQWECKRAVRTEEYNSTRSYRQRQKLKIHNIFLYYLPCTFAPTTMEYHNNTTQQPTNEEVRRSTSPGMSPSVGIASNRNVIDSVCINSKTAECRGSNITMMNDINTNHESQYQTSKETKTIDIVDILSDSDDDEIPIKNSKSVNANTNSATINSKQTYAPPTMEESTGKTNSSESNQNHNENENNQSNKTSPQNNDPNPSKNNNTTCSSNQKNDEDSDSDIEIIGVTPSKQINPTQSSIQQQHQHQHQHQYQQQNQQAMTQHQHHPEAMAPHQYQQQQSLMPQNRNTQIFFEMLHNNLLFLQPYFIDETQILPTKFIQTWEHILPPQPNATNNNHNNTFAKNQIRAYKLSLLSQNEFALTAISHRTNDWRYVPTLNGLRKVIKEITKHYGDGQKAVYEPQNEDNDTPGGKWRIPLSAYRSFVTYLLSDPNVFVESIPDRQLQIASLGRAVSGRQYPSPGKLMEWGVPKGLAHNLAPYQRGGVDFVIEKLGRALIADDMGLGKTIQSIASMCCYVEEWPLLVLTPSSARYHWEAEFLHWLGADSEINIENEQQYSEDYDQVLPYNTLPMKRKAVALQSASINNQALLQKNEVFVISSSKSFSISPPETRVVICSYGLIANLISMGSIYPGQFKCVIVDESHMLKNKSSKRTKAILPILKEATRVVMLSGTPALSKPIELYPQLTALDTRNGFWSNEDDFLEKYGKKEDAEANFAELHTLLTSTLMIRRMKPDVLKNLPGKVRENVHVNIRCSSLKMEIANCIQRLRQGKGTLGKLATQHNLKLAGEEEKKIDGNSASASDQDQDRTDDYLGIPPSCTSVSLDGNVENKSDEISQKAVLNHVYRITGNSKIPIIVEMLKHFLSDPKNGKICIFAHHLNILDAIIEKTLLRNHEGSKTKYIRIDGSTNPKTRQEKITLFQRDPSVRVAVLGITAAGVAVTLTAASTIWFAELFWTPAIMIQAEDRLVHIS